MEEKQEGTSRVSWFWKWFLNNQVVTGLIIVLLMLLVLNAFMKVSFLFKPIIQFLSVIALPIVLAGVLYYLLNPIVDYLEQKGLKRVYSIFLLFLVVIGLVLWGIVVIVPKIQEQTVSFVSNFPRYVDTINAKTNEVLSNPEFSDLQVQLDSYSGQIMDWVTGFIQNLSKTTISSLSNLVGIVTNVFVGIVTMPFLLFYLLKDGRDLAPYFAKFLPTKWRKPTLKVVAEMNEQISSYIRGQLIVAFAVAIMFIIGFTIVGLDYAVTLGIMAGFLNLIPFLGSFLAMIPAVFLALVAGPVMLVKVLIVFAVEQTIEGRVVSPLVLGNELSVHPVTILIVLLTSGKLFGLVGVIFGIPVYAAIKVIVTHFFEWYTDVSALYHDEEVEQTVEE